MNFKQFYTENNGLSTGVVLFFNENKVLILKRGSSAPWQPNMWSLPGGMCEPNENIEQCIIRETYEETKIKLVDVTYLKEYDDNWHVFTSRTEFQQTDLEMENQQLDWIRVDEIDNYEFVPDAKQAILLAFDSIS